jgi:serine/threonine protein kinase
MDQAAQGRVDQSLRGELKYNKVTIFEDVKFGSGAYGIVYKAKCDNTICAAKVLHDLLCNTGTASRPSEQFRQEIQLVLKLSHEAGSSNIVQCLGIHTNHTVSQMPILLMELMDCNLTNYLEDESVKMISMRTQLKICHDIILAVEFLHSHGIIHRDLSGNNILLTLSEHDHGDKTVRIAKVGDFGVAKMCHDLIPNRQSTCPGTHEYMPPEALVSMADYMEKLDCFSVGVLIIQILTRLYPKPKQLASSIDGSELRLLPEIERRQDHIDMVNPNNPLLRIAKDCLSNNPDDRPSAGSISRTIHSLMKLQFAWCVDLHAVCKMSRYSNAITNKGIIYLSPATSTNIYAYDPTKDQWSHRYSSQYLGSSLTFINSDLTTIGGKRRDSLFRYYDEDAITAGYASCYTNKLLSLDIESGTANWTNKLPSMPTNRACTVALNTGANLIVAGGVGGAILTTVEVMDIEKSQWMTAADLPQRMCGASGTLCGDRVYLMGGIGEKRDDLFTVFTCAVDNLLKSCESTSLKSMFTNLLTLGRSGANASTGSVWERLADIPVTRATCVSVHDCLLAIGGKNSNGKPATKFNIHIYNQVTSAYTWLAIDHIPSARYSCFAVADGSTIFIIGGHTDTGTPTNIVNVANVTISN